jgi:prepilin-type N-terminal cleavage/methylation domain-containing protein
VDLSALDPEDLKHWCDVSQVHPKNVRWSSRPTKAQTVHEVSPVFPVQRPGPPDAGFTLIEMLTALTVFGIAAATALTGLRGWTASLDQRGGAQAIVAELRRVQQEAVSQGRAMCMDFDVAGGAYTAYRGTCDDSTRSRVRGPSRLPTGTHLASPYFAGGAGSGTGVTFLPRGTSWGGSVRVTRVASTRVYTITVESLTGRVSLA